MTTQTQPQPQTEWALYKAHTVIEFAVKNMMVSTVKGRFTKFEGRLVGSLDDPTNARVELTIDASSIDTGNERRDAHLRSADFLDVENYPTITFASTRIEQTDTNTFQVTGDLAMRGITKEVELEVWIKDVEKTADGQEVVNLSATGALSRKAWGVRWNIVLEAGGVLVGDTVRINADVEAVNQGQVLTANDAGMAGGR